MTSSTFTSDVQALPATGSDYQPGVCNIGPHEIRRRRRIGHLGLVATVALLIGLVVIDAPAIARLLLVAPAALSASGYLQARMRFCAGYAQLGLVNFGGRGEQTAVADEAARRVDRRKARQIGLASFGIGLTVAVMAFALPF